MSDAGEELSDVSDVEVNEDFDDYDPLLEDDEEAPGTAQGEESDGEAAEGDDELGEILPEESATRRRQRRRAAEARREASQASGVRNIIIVPDEERVTSNVATLAEIARAIAIRAKQISENPSAYVDIGLLSDPETIARKELDERRTPLVLRRSVGRTSAGESIVELWKLREMSYPELRN